MHAIELQHTNLPRYRLTGSIYQPRGSVKDYQSMPSLQIWSVPGGAHASLCAWIFGCASKYSFENPGPRILDHAFISIQVGFTIGFNCEMKISDAVNNFKNIQKNGATFFAVAISSASSRASQAAGSSDMRSVSHFLFLMAPNVFPTRAVSPPSLHHSSSSSSTAAASATFKVFCIEGGILSQIVRTNLMTVQANRVKINLGDKLFVRRFCESPDYVSIDA